MKRFLIPVLFIVGNSYAAGIQKWVDEKGNVHYGDTPPVKAKTQTITVTHPPANPGKPLPRLSDVNKDKEESTGDTQQNTQKDQTNKKAQELCEKYKANYNIIINSDIIRATEEDGSERFLSDQEVDERRKKLEENIKLYCK